MDVSSKYCNLAYSNQSVLLGSELVFLIPMVGSAIARYRVESNGATYCTLGGSSGSNEWRRTLCTLRRLFLALVEAYYRMLIDGGTVSRVRRSQYSVSVLLGAGS